MTILETEADYLSELASVGEKFLSLISATEILGHAPPVETLEYTKGSELQVATDFVAWCGRYKGWEDARDRCIAYANELGFGRLQAHRLAQLVPKELDP